MLAMFLTVLYKVEGLETERRLRVSNNSLYLINMW